MLITREKKVVFVHIPRTGGTSIKNVLWATASDWEEWPSGHATIADLEQNLGPKADQYFKFALFRNPWERLYSWHQLLEKSGAQFPFEEFILDPENIFRGPEFSFSQHDYVVREDGTLGVDVIGKFEDFESEASRVLKLAGLDAEKPGHYNSV